MRKHLVVLIAAVALAVAGCTSAPEYKKESEVPTTKPSVTASESSESAEEPSPTTSESATPSEQPTTDKPATEPSDQSAEPSQPAKCQFDDDWSTAPIRNFDNPVAGDIGSDDTSGKIYAIDIGQHDCFDRIVIRVDTDQEVGLRAEYVDAVRTPGKGDAVLLQGDADLQILVQAWTADTNALYSFDVESSSWPVLRQVVQAGSFEGQTTIAVGVDHKAPFKVYYLPADDGTMRIVVDIAHQ